jgi:hypothetical protein
MLKPDPVTFLEHNEIPQGPEAPVAPEAGERLRKRIESTAHDLSARPASKLSS